MSRVQRIVLIAGVAMLATPAAGSAAPSRGPVETVRAYVAALRVNDVKGACALLMPGYYPTAAQCHQDLRASLRDEGLARATIEPGAAIRGLRARVVVDVVQGTRGGAPWAARARVLLVRHDGRWRIRQTGPLFGVDRAPGRSTPADVPPAGGSAQLRRLADDELLVVSGNERGLCQLLAPGAPLGGTRGGCASAGLFGSLDEIRYDARADRVAIRRIAADRARLDVAFTIREAVRAKGRPGWAIHAHRRTDRLYAVRSDGRWRLAKLSRWAYLLLGVRPPDDAAAPAATATWPFTDVPSLSERPVPAECRTPRTVQAQTCPILAGLATGGGMVTWTWFGAAQALARPVAAGQPTGATAAVSSVSKPAGRYWLPEAVAPVPGGALVLERDLQGSGSALRAVPVGPDGRPRGAAQPLTDAEAGEGEVPFPRLAPGVPGATTSTVVLASGRVVRLGADGRPTGLQGQVRDLFSTTRHLARPDGTLLEIGGGGDPELVIQPLAADGRSSGAAITQALLPRSTGRVAVAGAQAADGRVLVAWIESDDGGRGTVRAWVFDPAAPTATAPLTVAAIPQAVAVDDLFATPDEALAATALPGGGWGLAWGWNAKPGRPTLWAARLDAAGAPTVAPRRVTTRLGQTALGRAGFGLAGDTVAFIEWPAVAGLPQVRAAPLP